MSATESLSPPAVAPLNPKFKQVPSWTVDAVLELYRLPFMDLVFRAAEVHRRNFDPNAIQRSSLLSVKTGGCSEDCGYCSQSKVSDAEIPKYNILSREKLLEKVERIEAPLEGLSGPRFQFPPAPRSGRQVAVIDDLTHSYGEKILFLGAHLEVERGDRIAFVGPNGAGKSTLLRLVMGLETPDGGQAGLGEHNVIAGYFEQNQAEALNLERSVVDTLFEAVPDWTQTQVRSLLGNFGFSNDDVFKEVGQLSGGEKARLALALMLLTPCNLLVLDEPTNHLDIPAKQMLESALQGYEGAALIVSHDRYFISQVANRIVELRDGELVLYRGDYAYYLEKKAEEAEAQRLAQQERVKQARQEANRQKQKDKTQSRRARAGS